MKSGLLFRLGGLGDLLVALPSIQLLKRILPGCSLKLVCRTEYGRLLKDAGVVNAVLPAEDRRWLPLFDERPDGAVPPDFRKWLAEYDFMLAWLHQETSRTLERKIVALTAGNGRFIVYEPRSGIPISRSFFDQTLALVAGPREANDQFDDLGRLPLLKSEEQRGNLSEVPSAGPKKFVVVHPGSGSEKKCWPLENFLKIMEFLHQKGNDGFLVTGEAEDRIESTIPALALPPGWSWLRRPPLLKLAGLLRKAAFYIGNDSGVTHLAAACGTRGLALFRKDLEVAWKPYGRIDVLSDRELAAITLDSTIAKIRFFML